MTTSIRSGILAVLGAIVTGPRVDAIVGGFIPPNDEFRFDAVGAFGRTVNLNCTNQCSNHFGAGTLVDCEWVLIARHLLTWRQAGSVTQDPFDSEWYPPDPGFWSVRFRRSPDGSVGEFNSSLPDQGSSSFFHVAVVEFVLPNDGRDMALARLAEPVTHIKPIRVRFADASTLDTGTEILLVSWGQQFQLGITCQSNPLLYQASRKLKVAPTVTSESSAISEDVDWLSPCSSVCECGGHFNDSGGGVLVQLPCGKVELVAVMIGATKGQLVHPYEGSSTFPIPIFENPCSADLNGDDQVNGSDLGQLLLDWGNPGCAGHEVCDSDLDCNGSVDGADLGLLLLQWGVCAGTCGGESLAGYAAQAQQGFSETANPFHEWALHASLEELLTWLETGDWGG